MTKTDIPYFLGVPFSFVHQCMQLYLSMHASFFLYILVTFTGFNPNTGCNFPLSVSLSWIRFHSVIQLEKAWWLVVWIQWSGKTRFLIWNSVTGKIWEILNHWCMCVWFCLPSSVECLPHISFYSIANYPKWNFIPIPPWVGRSRWFDHVTKQLILALTKKRKEMKRWSYHFYQLIIPLSCHLSFQFFILFYILFK